MTAWASNAGWLLLPRGLRLVTGLAVGILVTRHLGPARYGQFAFAVALSGLLGPLSKLGLDGFVVRDMVREPAQVGRTAGTAAALKASGALVGLVAALALCALMRPGDRVALLATGLVSLHFVLRTGEVMEFWFRAREHTRPIGLAQSLGLVLSAATSIACVLSGAPVWAFAGAFVVEALATHVGLWTAYRRQRSPDPPSWSARRLRARQLLSEAWPLALSALFALMALQVDQLMIAAMLDAQQLGLYASAVRLSSALYLVPMVVCQALQPRLVAARAGDPQQYFDDLQALMALLVGIAYVAAVPIALLAEPIVRLLYGEAFDAAAPVLAAHAFGGLFVAANAPRGLWVTDLSLARYALLANALTATSNIALNLLLIPQIGIMGAAYATLASYVLGHILATGLFPNGRRILAMQMRALGLQALPSAWRLLHSGLGRTP